MLHVLYFVCTLSHLLLKEIFEHIVYFFHEYDVFVLHEILCLILICVVFNKLLLMSFVYIEVFVEMLQM